MEGPGGKAASNEERERERERERETDRESARAREREPLQFCTSNEVKDTLESSTGIAVCMART
eukprot:SAG22_NODE_21712_length_254_cov_1.554839_1_plen_62_part_10